MADRYIELHARSAFSFLEGSSVPEDLVECKRQTNTCQAVGIVGRGLKSRYSSGSLDSDKQNILAKMFAGVSGPSAGKGLF